MPQFVLVAGPNGSGKTTLVRKGTLLTRLGIEPNAVMINADDMAREMAGGDQPSSEHSLRAAQLGDEELDRCIVAGQSVLIETVLSSDKFRHRVQAAKDAGFSVTLIYVTLRLAALNVQRVDQRHDLGGHAVPPDRIVARRARSHANFAWFASAADRVLLFDNTDQAGPVFVAGCEAGEWDIVAIERLPRDLYRAVRKLAGLSKR